jgi:PAS domain S-box-containing protein
MPGKPTYEELERRNKELEKEVVNCKRTEQELQEIEKRFKNVTNSIEELIVFVDQNLKVQMINSTLAQTWNISLDDCAGEYCYELFYGCNHICEGCPAIQVLNEGKVTRGALRYRPDGRIIDRTAYPFIDDNGDITGVIVIGCDITQQKQTEEELRKSEEKYRTLLETTLQGCWLINPEHKTVEVNPSICKMLGYRPDEILGKTPFDFVDDENRKIFIDQFSKISVTAHRSYEITLKKKNGQDLQTYFNATTIRDESGEVQGSFAFISDITDIKQAEQRLKQREKELGIKNIRLKEMNTALNILLKKRDEDKTELEEKVMTNITELVLPYVAKLKNTGLNHRQEIFADIIQSNIEEIISPFAHKLSHKYLNFTPAELKVAYLVKQGLRTKEIAKLLNSSPETITRHRKSMRKKLKLTDKKSNLRTHLLSLANGYIE